MLRPLSPPNPINDTHRFTHTVVGCRHIIVLKPQTACGIGTPRPAERDRCFYISSDDSKNFCHLGLEATHQDVGG